MDILELLLIAVGLSMDAFAVAVCAGLTMKKFTIKKALTVGIYFGFFQAVMPLIGYMTATLFAEKIINLDHWIAFGLLSFIGGNMIIGSLKKEGCRDRECPVEVGKTCLDRKCPDGKRPSNEEVSLGLKKMLPLAIATSIDALAVGVSFAFILESRIVPVAVILIGIVTLALSMFGVKIGNIFGKKFKSKAELTGGIILILMGTKILLEHLGVFRNC